ncbi:GTPase Era, mitochondrial-like [Antedon mediterranea]|uniref:GTPase Era, mitochondrial-like n=1 Tax=Antedon mediterranea TaxID=105859 RepID=UPI003AF72F03
MATSIIRNVFKFMRVYSFESSTCRKNLVISCRRAYSFKLTILKNPLRCVSQSQINKKPLSTHSLDDDVQQNHGDDTAEVFEPINPDKGAQELLLIKPPVQPENPRCVRAAIIGTPNAGKSTLVNTLLGRRICAVSKKVHTTRRQATAVLTERDTQVIILDTPGMVNMSSARRHALPRELIVSPKSTLSIADLIIVIVDVADKWTCKKISTDILIELNNFRETPCILVLNKVDMLKNKQSLVELTALLTDGIIEGKAIEMSDRLTQKLLKNRGFRNKYLQYKGLSEETELNNKKETELEVSEGEESEGGLDIASKEDRLSEHSKSFDGENSLEDLKNESLHNMSTNNHLDSEELSNHHLEKSTSNRNDEQIVFENHTIGLNSEKAEFLNQYINNLNGISNVYRPKETDNTDDGKNQQLEANRRKRELFKEFKGRKGWHLFQKVFMISAKTGDGVQELKEFVIDKATPQEWEYHKKVVTDLSPLQILEDAIREQLLECLEQEIPYNIDQRNLYWDYDESGTLLINQKLICYKKSHYGSILRRIRTIARFSEQDLMDAFHCDIMLKLSVVLAK